MRDLKKNNILLLIKNYKSSKFSKDTIWLLAAQIILITSGLSLNLIIGSKYGPATLGVFNQVLSFYLILTAIFSFGLNNSILQKISSNRKDDISKIFSSNLFLTIGISTTLIFFSILITSHFPGLFSSSEVAKGLMPTLFAVPLFNANKNFMALDTALRAQKAFAVTRAARWIILIVLISLNIFTFKSKEGIFYSFFFTELFLLIFHLVKNKYFLTKWIKLSELKDNLNFGFKSFSAEIFSIFNSQADILIIGYFLTQTEVGVFSFYIFFVKAIFILPGIIQQNINPIISKHWKEQTISLLEDQLKVLRKNNWRVISFIALITGVLYFLLVTIFRTGFYQSLPFFYVNLIFAIPLATISWGGAALVMAEKLKANLLRTGIILIFSIVSLLLLTFSFGLVGACIAVSLNFVFQFFMLFKYVQKDLGIKLI